MGLKIKKIINAHSYRIIVDKKNFSYVSITEMIYRESNNNPKFTKREFKNAYESSIKLLKNLLENGKDVVFDASLCDLSSRKKVMNFIKEKPKFKVYIIQLKAEPKIIKERIIETYCTHPDKDVTPERGFRLAKNYKKIEKSIEIDSGKLSPEEIYKKLVNMGIF
ncbi:MAG: hypothetical protein QXY45_04320 [Candidatus Aenigmatarchaeota archaeon]